jgi:hypothetical protein
MVVAFAITNDKSLLANSAGIELIIVGQSV